MNKINFFHNWGSKLDCDCFTTIRKSTPEKLAYYRSQLNKEFMVVLKGEEQHKVVLKNVDVLRFKELTLASIAVDVGISDKEKFKKIFSKFGIELDTTVLLLLFERVD